MYVWVWVCVCICVDVHVLYLICIHLVILQLIVEAFLLYRNSRHLYNRKALLLLLACFADSHVRVCAGVKSSDIFKYTSSTATPLYSKLN